MLDRSSRECSRPDTLLRPIACFPPAASATKSLEGFEKSRKSPVAFAVLRVSLLPGVALLLAGITFEPGGLLGELADRRVTCIQCASIKCASR